MLADVITAEDVPEADGIRRDRALAEYGDYPASQFSTGQVTAAADVAERIVNALASELARQAGQKSS